MSFSQHPIFHMLPSDVQAELAPIAREMKERTLMIGPAHASELATIVTITVVWCVREIVKLRSSNTYR